MALLRSSRPENSCPSCGKPVRGAPAQLQRRLPSFFVLRTCGPCGTTFRLRADDRGDSLEDSQRLASLYATLAGEVWTDGDRVYWYRQPMASRLTALA